LQVHVGRHHAHRRSSLVGQEFAHALQYFVRLLIKMKLHQVGRIGDQLGGVGAVAGNQFFQFGKPEAGFLPPVVGDKNVVGQQEFNQLRQVHDFRLAARGQRHILFLGQPQRAITIHIVGGQVLALQQVAASQQYAVGIHRRRGVQQQILEYGLGFLDIV
jgi:hypothetical protein